MIRAVLDADGEGIAKISGYVTDKLGRASDEAPQKLGRRTVKSVGGGWVVRTEIIAGRRYVVFLNDDIDDNA